MAAPDKKTVMKDLLEMGKAKGQLPQKRFWMLWESWTLSRNKLKNFMIH